MPRIYPTDWKTLIKVFELYGCKYKRKEGSHHVLTCPGAKRAIVIPEYDEIEVDMEMHDKLIVATALYFKAALITRDERIKNIGLCSTVW